MRNKAAVFFLFSFIGAGALTGVFAQNSNVGINTTGALPDNSALLDVASTNKGMLMPRVSLISNTDVATIASPATSLLVYNTNAAMSNGNGTGFYYWNGSVWLPIGMNSTSPCQVTAITNELDGAGAPCAGVGCGATMSITMCSTYCANLSYNGYSDWAMPTLSDAYSLLAIAPGNTSANQVWTCSFGAAGNAYAGLVYSTGNDDHLTSTAAIYYCRCVR